MKTILGALAIASALAAGPGLGQSVPAPADTPAAPMKARPWAACESWAKWFDTQCAGLRSAWYDGKPIVYLTGYTYHDRSTYTDDKLEEFNEKAWGGGFGLGSYQASNGDHFDWYAMIFRDSHFKYTKSVGWSWVTYWPEHSDYAVGLGYTAFLMSRPDIANNVPFPAALPVASLKFGRAEVLGTFIPKLNAGVNHGNVAFFFGRYQF
ncbi:MAG: hypothetical protein ABI585_09035 [Betaproteobacteria bacterium]